MFFKPMPIFISVVTFVVVVRVLIKKNDNGYDKAVDNFLDKEEKANKTNKDFDELNLHFVSPAKNLPFKEYETIPQYKNLIKKQNFVKRKIKLDIIKIPSNLTNTELKEMYGANNFKKISILEEHYNSYVRGLYEWALELYNVNNIYDCKQVLLEAIRLEANISDVYCLLAKIYKKENDKQKLINLRDSVYNINLSLKESTIKKIDEIINNLI